MQDTMDQKLMDSEESYLNTTFWEIYPLFLQVQNGDEAALRAALDIHLDQFPAGRITRDARKQYEYLTVSLVNTFMIAAIEGGVYPPDANAIADQALRKLSQIRSVSELPWSPRRSTKTPATSMWRVPSTTSPLTLLRRSAQRTSPRM